MIKNNVTSDCTIGKAIKLQINKGTFSSNPFILYNQTFVSIKQKN